MIKGSGNFFRRTLSLIKKDARSSVRSVLPTLALIAVLALGCIFLCMSTISGAQKKEELLSIGIVDKDKSIVSKLAVGMVTANEQISSLFSVVSFDSEEAAYDAVRNGETVAALIFEKDYFHKILDGESSAVSVMLSRTIDMHSQLIRDFAHTGEILIKTGEYGVNAAWQPMLDASASYGSATFKFNAFSLQYAVDILALTGSSVDDIVLPYSKTSTSLSGHYILHYCVFLLALVDMLFFEFVRRDSSRALLSRLKSSGIGGMHIIMSKLPTVLAVKAALTVAIFFGLSGMFSFDLAAQNVLSIIFFLIFSSVFGVCLCALTQTSDVGPCIIAALAFAGLFLCGALVSYDMLDVSVTTLGTYTPIGVGVGIMAPVFGASPSAIQYILAIGYSAIMLYFAKRRFDALCIAGGDGV